MKVLQWFKFIVSLIFTKKSKNWHVKKCEKAAKNHSMPKLKCWMEEGIWTKQKILLNFTDFTILLLAYPVKNVCVRSDLNMNLRSLSLFQKAKCSHLSPLSSWVNTSLPFIEKKGLKGIVLQDPYFQGVSEIRWLPGSSTLQKGTQGEAQWWIRQQPSGTAPPALKMCPIA